MTGTDVCVLLSLLLSNNLYSHFFYPGSWSDICSSVFRYAAQIPATYHSQPLLMSRLENLLEKFKLKTWHTRTPGSKTTTRYSETGVQREHLANSQIPWDDVVVICIDHKLKDRQIPAPPVCEGEDLIYGNILIFHLY